MGTARFTSKPDLVSGTLTYPATITTGGNAGDTAGGLTLTFGQFVALAQQGIQCQKSDGTIIFTIGPAGGPKAATVRWKCAHAVGGSYAALCGDNANGIPYVELPDGASQGLRLFAGTGAPAAGTVGPAASGLHRIGDFYFRQRTGTVTQLIYACTAVGSGSGAGTWAQVV